MIPIQIRDTERAAIQLLKPALETALYEADVELEVPSEYTGVRGFFDDNIKVNKLAYAAIEEYDLPLLRTWYKYGQYEPYKEITPKSLDVGDNSDDAYVPSPLKTDVTQERIKEYLLSRDLASMFEKDLFDFLVENYREWDPEPYTDTYVASTGIIRVLEEINTASEKEIVNNSNELWDDLKQSSIDLRYDLQSIETFDDELHEHAQIYLRELEDALRRIDENSEISEKQKETMDEARTVYHNFVWPWAALQISLDKAKGPEDSKEGFNKSGSKILEQDKASYVTHLTGWKTQLQKDNLSPQFSARKSDSPTPTSLADLQRAALENN
ncbi:hypothetical protein KI372_04180 [Halobacterium salinarum]|uniref:hypothetical protein n=1 Tax=Halobacterium salinarum TaxID=2242 RepID=UPI001F3C0B4D|nr:hypothetical protein [Halobacterium salinarum]MCF2206353.1 hypothetical protein [Halobacterium salinarum]MCF2240615.1 hypothetical protein [Halobacterium salinarum]